MSSTGRIKFLFITNDLEHYVERNPYYLSQELARLTDLQVWTEPGEISRILGQLPEQPDFILLNDIKESRCPEIRGLSALRVPWGILVHDLHYRVAKRRRFMAENGVRHIFTVYRDAFLRTFPEFSRQMHWLPHFVNTQIFKDYGQAREIDLLMMGKVAFYYPLRQVMLKAFRDRPGFVYHPHPGYRNIPEGEQPEVFVGERYAREIGRARIFLTCDSTLHYPIIKYYEVPACKTLLLAPNVPELQDLGFKPGVHFVEIGRRNFRELAEYYLQHDAEREAIAAAGYDLVHTRHSAAQRASELVQMIAEICNQG